jgi:hypothetical protein
MGRGDRREEIFRDDLDRKRFLQALEAMSHQPCDNIPVAESDRDRILNNTRDAFRFQGFEIDVI